MALDATAETALNAIAEAHDLKQWDRAVALGDAWVEARGEMPVLACVFYAQSLMGVGRYQDAEKWAAAAAKLMPKEERVAYVATLSTYAQALARVGKLVPARRTLKHLAIQPVDHPEALEKQGHIWLSVSEKWRRGWEMHEARLEQPGKSFAAPTRRWDGVTKEPVAVLHEQGIGDAILFARWIPWLAEYTGHDVTWFGPELLHDWMRALPNVVIGTAEEEKAMLDAGESIAAVYAMSLPYYAGVNRPSQVPKPIAPGSLIDLRSKLAMARQHMPFVRIGVCWQGAKHGWHDFERSFTAEQFAPVIEPIEGVTFVNLAHDAEVPASFPFERRVFGDVFDTAEAVAQCDLVISVDTSVVHIAGSLGVPTLALVPTVPDWRYQWPIGNATPFYKSVTVARRKSGDDLTVLTVARQMAERYTTALRRKTA